VYNGDDIIFIFIILILGFSALLSCCHYSCRDMSGAYQTVTVVGARLLRRYPDDMEVESKVGRFRK
jgi:hypothetical protein